MRSNYYILLITFLMVQLVAPAQTSSFKRCPVKVINFEQGLLNNETMEVLTDISGFTWVSTRTGLQRFNGYSLDNINPVIGGDSILINSHVYLFAAQDKSIRISYKNGLLSYNPLTRSFKKIISLAAADNSFFPIVPLLETKEGVWCIQQNKGIVIYNDQSKQVGIVTANIEDINSLISSDELVTNTIIAVNKKYIFIRITPQQILEINTDTRQVKYIRGGDNIIGIGCDDDRLFITTSTRLSSINITDGKQVKTYVFENIIRENLLYSCIQHEDNNKLLVSLNRRLYEFDSSLAYANEFITLNEDPVVPSGMIHHLYTDGFKRIWLLTNNDIRIIQNFDMPFEHFVYKNEKSNFVRSLYYDEQEKILLAGCINSDKGINGGIQLYDTSGNPLWAKALVTDRVMNISNIEKLDKGKYLVITSDQQGWYLLDLQKKQLNKFRLPVAPNTEQELYSTVWPNNLQRINDSTVLLASSINIFESVFKKTAIKSVKALLPFNGSQSNIIDCFIYTADQTFWIGTNAGIVYRFKGKENLQTIHVPGNYIIRCFAEDSMHHVWIGTDKGIYVYSASGELLKTITSQTGLLNDYIYAILPADKADAVFMSCKLGISYVPLNGPVKNYTRELGLQENEFNTESALRNAAGKYFFGGVNGITAFYPSALSDVKDNPVLNITHLVINNSSYDFSPGIWRNDSIVLNYDQNHLQLDLAALGLLSTNEYVYRYRLKNFEDDWQTIHEPTGIKYVLPPGNYLFEISCNPIFSSKDISTRNIVIIVSPPWWQTWWFRAAMILLAVAIIVLTVQQYNRRKYLKRIRRLQLQHELQQERERISRDLHDNLGAYAAAIASNVSAIQKDQQGNDTNALHQLKSNSQSIITQLNDTIWTLNKEAILLTGISDRFKVFLQKIQPNYPAISISIKENILWDQTLSPQHALHLFRLMQESVNNALRHSNCSTISIMIESNGGWSVSIKDDGKGFFESDEKVIKGNGLKNMQLRSKEAGWEITWKKVVPRGTEITIKSSLN